MSSNLLHRFQQRVRSMVQQRQNLERDRSPLGGGSGDGGVGVGGGDAAFDDARRVQRVLFGPVNHEETLRFVQEELAKGQEAAKRRWNYDFHNDRPIDGGQFLWEPADGAGAGAHAHHQQQQHQPPLLSELRRTVDRPSSASPPATVSTDFGRDPGPPACGTSAAVAAAVRSRGCSSGQTHCQRGDEVSEAAAGEDHEDAKNVPLSSSVPSIRTANAVDQRGAAVAAGSSTKEPPAEVVDVLLLAEGPALPIHSLQRVPSGTVPCPADGISMASLSSSNMSSSSNRRDTEADGAIGTHRRPAATSQSTTSQSSSSSSDCPGPRRGHGKEAPSCDSMAVPLAGGAFSTAKKKPKSSKSSPSPSGRSTRRTIAHQRSRSHSTQSRITGIFRERKRSDPKSKLSSSIKVQERKHHESPSPPPPPPQIPGVPQQLSDRAPQAIHSEQAFVAP